MSKSADFKPLSNFTRDRKCFACGKDNPFGLHMKFKSDGRCVISNITVPTHLCGWRRLVHGGIISTLMDEVMSWTAIHLLQKLILTRSMQIEFLRPVYAQVPLRVEGRVEQEASSKEAVINGTLTQIEDNKLCARSTGRFALFSARSMHRMRIIDEQTVSDFENHFFHGAS